MVLDEIKHKPDRIREKARTWVRRVRDYRTNIRTNFVLKYAALVLIIILTVGYLLEN